MKKYDELTFTDDFMFANVMYDDMELCAELLTLILGRRVREVRAVEYQKTISLTPEAKGVRLDVYLEDDQSVYDIEMQVATYDELPFRCRYYHDVLDLNQLERGEHYSELRPTYVIFLCKEEPPVGSLDAVSVFRMCHVAPAEEAGADGAGPEPGDAADGFEVRSDGRRKGRYVYYPSGVRVDYLDDESYTVIVNAAYRGSRMSAEMDAFLEYLRQGEPADEISPLIGRIHQKVIDARLHSRWRTEYMTLEMRDQENYRKWKAEGIAEGKAAGIAEGKAEGIAEGKAAGRQDLVLELLRSGLLTLSEAARTLGMSEDVFRSTFLKEFPQV